MSVMYNPLERQDLLKELSILCRHQVFLNSSGVATLLNKTPCGQPYGFNQQFVACIRLDLCNLLCLRESRIFHGTLHSESVPKMYHGADNTSFGSESIIFFPHSVYSSIHSCTGTLATHYCFSIDPFNNNHTPCYFC